MYDYQLVPDVLSSEIPAVTQQEQRKGWGVDNIFQRQSPGGTPGQVVYDILFRKASKDTSYGQMLVNRAYGKLKEVADTLEQVNTHPAIVKDIREFLFQGSPDDM